MTATAIVLHRDPGGPEWDHLTELDGWVKSGMGRYWHLPRSAHRHKKSKRTAVTLWCGSMFSSLSRCEVGAPHDGPMCGTCVGRYEGWRDGSAIIFDPVDHWQPPARCPGLSWREGTRDCTVCGEPVQWGRHPWGAYSTASHKPGPGIRDVRPCKYHGWKHTYERHGVLVCTAWGCMP